MKHNWTEIETEYITTHTSYAKIAEKHGVPLCTLTKYAQKNKWFKKRREYTENVVAKTAEEIAKHNAKKLAKLTKAADTMTDVVDRILKDAEQFNRHINGFGEEKVCKKADTKAIKDITVAIKELTSVVRNLNNIPTQAEMEAQRIASERLELEKKKADMDSDSNKEIRVIIEGDAEDYAG